MFKIKITEDMRNDYTLHSTSRWMPADYDAMLIDVRERTGFFKKIKDVLGI